MPSSLLPKVFRKGARDFRALFFSKEKGMDVIFNLLLCVIVFIVGGYAYNTSRKLTNVTRLITAEREKAKVEEEYIETVSGVKRNVLGYLIEHYFNATNVRPAKDYVVPDYDTFTYMLDQMARQVGLTYIDAVICLVSEDGHQHLYSDAKRFIKLLKTVRGAITKRPVRSDFVFDYDEMTDDERALVIALLASNAKFIVSYTSKHDTGECKVEIRSSLLCSDERIYQIYLDIISEYKKSIGRNTIMHPGIVPIRVAVRDFLFSLKIKKGAEDFKSVHYLPDVVVAFLTAYSMIEKEPIYALCTGNYPLAIHIYNIVYQEKRKTTLKAIPRVE